MQNYSDWKNNAHNSPILDALNRGGQSNVSTFGSVDDFLAGLLGNRFNTSKTQQQDQEAAGSFPKDEVPPKPDYAEETRKDTIIIPEIEDEDINDHEEEEINNIDTSGRYKIYRDKEEIFECNISVQGAKVSSSQVRLILDHDICNLVFYGKVHKDGKCVVPLKRMSFYSEGSTGRIRLEVVVDDSIFVPWEETFVVEGAKKVIVDVKPQKNVNFRF